MANTTEVQQCEIGAEIEVDFLDENGDPIDISDATLKQINFKRPDGSTLCFIAEFKDDGEDGQLIYTTAAGDLEQAGWWSVQAYIELQNGLTSKYSPANPLRVVQNIFSTEI